MSATITMSPEEIAASAVYNAVEAAILAMPQYAGCYAEAREIAEAAYKTALYREQNPFNGGLKP